MKHKLTKEAEKRMNKEFGILKNTPGGDEWYCVEKLSLNSFLAKELHLQKEGLIEEIKRWLPTHKGKTLTRNEVKKYLNKL